MVSRELHQALAMGFYLQNSLLIRKNTSSSIKKGVALFRHFSRRLSTMLQSRSTPEEDPSVKSKFT